MRTHTQDASTNTQPRNMRTHTQDASTNTQPRNMRTHTQDASTNRKLCISQERMHALNSQMNTENAYANSKRFHKKYSMHAYLVNRLFDIRHEASQVRLQTSIKHKYQLPQQLKTTFLCPERLLFQLLGDCFDHFVNVQGARYGRRVHLTTGLAVFLHKRSVFMCDFQACFRSKVCLCESFRPV